MIWQDDAATLYALYEQEADPNNQRRFYALWLLRQDKTIKDAAAVVGVHTSTIQRWKKWYRIGGVDELRRPPRQTPKPPTVSYTFLQPESVSTAVKRIGAELIDRAIWQLTMPVPNRDKAVHDARKCFKKIRAILRLVRDEIGPDLFQRENTCYRNAGRLLAPVRDSTVMIESLDALTNHFAEALPANAFATVRQRLEARHAAICQQLLDEEERMAQVADIVREARPRLLALPIKNESFTAMYDSLLRVYSRGRKRRLEAYAAPSPERFHEWRKRLKYLWYHTRILRPIWPAYMENLAGQLDILADYLGDDHDLAVLQALLIAEPALCPDQTEQTHLFALIERRRRLYQADALPVGKRIYVEKPKSFVKRIEGYWQAMTSEWTEQLEAS